MTHDPGGKIRWRVPDGISCSASFSEDRVYRRSLTRTWANGRGTCMFVGMNPSTADSADDDPTVRKEWTMAKVWGYAGYVKCNVMDYRATKPSDLLRPGVVACSPENLVIITTHARAATRVVAAWGKPPKAMMQHVWNAIQMFHEWHVELWCLGTNVDGSPRHPLFLSLDTELVRWRG